MYEVFQESKGFSVEQDKMIARVLRYDGFRVVRQELMVLIYPSVRCCLFVRVMNSVIWWFSKLVTLVLLLSFIPA